MIERLKRELEEAEGELLERTQTLGSMRGQRDNLLVLEARNANGLIALIGQERVCRAEEEIARQRVAELETGVSEDILNSILNAN